MSIINKAAVLNPFSDLTANILNYVPRATTSEFGIVAIGSGINVDALGRIYLDTQEYSDRLTAIEAQAASSLTTQQTEVAAAIAQVNLAQSQTITALTLEVSNLKTDLTNSITATQTDLINRADQLAQDVTDITQQLTQDKATFTQEIQDAIESLQDGASVASALRTPRKIQGVDFDGTQDINLPVFTAQIDGLVPKRVGATTTKYLREDGTWVAPLNTTYGLLTKTDAETGTATTANTISAKVLKDAIKFHAPTVTNIVGNAATATKLQTARTINGVAFDGSGNITVTDSSALAKASNLSDLANKTTARTNLDVYSKSEVTTAIASATPTLPDATETVAGKAKIATTAIALAGANDTDIITAKKLANTRQSVWVNKAGMLFGTTYVNTTLYEKEISFLSGIAIGVPLTAKVTFKNLTTNIETIVYFGCAFSGTNGIVSAVNFTVPPNTSFKIEIVQTDSLSTVITLAVSQWSERYYV